jgi:hypothetical protein
MKRLLMAVALGFGTLLTCPTPAAAVDSGFSQPGQNARFTADEIVQFSKQIEADLARQGARLAIVFRTGRAREDLPDGIAYTHGAFWVYQTITLADGRQVPGYAVYNLYTGSGEASRTSHLAQDFPVDFVAGSAVDDVAIILPTPEMQRRILSVMASPTYENLHNPDYSLISNPHDGRYQNCNAFMLDIVASAAWETTDAAQIRANLRAHFVPTRVRVGAAERMFGPLFDDRLRTDDQPGGRILTATYESIAAFMTDHGLAARTYTLARDPEFISEP